MKRLLHSGQLAVSTLLLAILTLLFTFSTNVTFAADVSVDKYGYLNYVGTIVNGDSEKVKALLSSDKEMQPILFIRSTGGNVIDAITTANLLTAFDMSVAAAKECVSACTFLLFSGKKKYVRRGTRVGIHCPSYTYASGNTSYIEAGNPTYWKLYGMIRAGGMSDIKTHKFLDMTFSHKSDEMRYLTEKELKYFGFNFVEGK